MPRPLFELLHPACPIKPAWAVFDRAWYLRHYPDARALCEGKPEEAALLYYLRVGARLGHSPSAVFDEAFYLARNPDIAELVRAAAYHCGFDHFCQHGHRGVSPHWLFDDELYANLYEDMTLENLTLHNCHGRYDHYLKSGQFETRMGHFLFDAAFYRAGALADGVAPAELERFGPYVHFLCRLGSGAEELAPSVYFDPAWYVEHHPGAKAEIIRGRHASAIQHYLCNETPEHFDPVPQFSENFYRRRHPDIAAAIEMGLYRCAYQQFVQYGAFELRQPAPGIDLAYYRDLHERVRHDLNAGTVRDAFAHLRLIGLAESLVYCPPQARPVLDEALTRALFLAKAQTNLALFARRKLDFSTGGNPVLSVIMVAFNRFALTMLALSSLRDNFSGPLQLIIVDNASQDETRRIGAFVQGAKILRPAQNIGFLRACNLALAEVQAPAVLFLNNDIELFHGAVAAALARLAADHKTGAVCAKIIRTNGRLQEAGSIIWNEGTTAGYMRDASPLAGEANFLREVDYGSAVFLLCRAELVRTLGGFDEAFAPAYFEDVDLCVRMIDAGYRVVYDPAIAVTHMEFGSATTTEASMALMRRGRRIFKKKHKAFLAAQQPPLASNIFRARNRAQRPAVLFLEDTVPRRQLGSGFVRSNDIVRAIAAAGYEVHVYPLNGALQDTAGLFEDFPETAELLHDHDFTNLPEFLAARADLYDLVWVARTHNFSRVVPLLRAAGVAPPLVLDTEAIAAARMAAHAAVTSAAAVDFASALREEFAGTEICAQILAVNAREADMLRKLGLGSVRVLGTACAPALAETPFAAREGLLFVAAIHQEDSPNLDALRWYTEKLLPELAAAFGNPPRLDVVGYVAPDIDLSAFAQNKFIKLHGPAGDLAPFYAAARVCIAPTRFAAGTPYKVYETASFGLPCVASDLLVAQLGWRDGVEILSSPVNNAQAFAAAIARLYQDPDLWRNLQKNALERLVAENGFTAFDETVRKILETSATARSFQAEP